MLFNSFSEIGFQTVAWIHGIVYRGNSTAVIFIWKCKTHLFWTSFELGLFRLNPKRFSTDGLKKGPIRIRWIVTCFMKAAVPVLSVRQRLLHTMPDGNHNAIAPFNTFKAPSMPHCVLLLAARCFMRKTQARVPWIEQFCIIRIEAYLNWQHHRLLLDTFTTHLHEADK